MKSKGRKYFKCNEFGHVASACPQKKGSPKGSTKTVCNVTSADGGKSHTTLKIETSKLRALLDTGSDLTFIRLYKLYPLPKVMLIKECDNSIIARLIRAQREDENLLGLLMIAENNKKDDFTMKSGLCTK